MRFAGGCQDEVSFLLPTLQGFMRVVIDTNVLTGAFRSRSGASFQILALIQGGQLLPLVSTTLFSEYEAVMKRPEQRAVSGLSEADVDDILAIIANLAQGVHIDFRWRPQLIDPGDEMVLDAAVNGRAEVVITYNVRHLKDACRRFGIPVMTPADVLRRLV